MCNVQQKVCKRSILKEPVDVSCKEDLSSYNTTTSGTSPIVCKLTCLFQCLSFLSYRKGARARCIQCLAKPNATAPAGRDQAGRPTNHVGNPAKRPRGAEGMADQNKAAVVAAPVPAEDGGQSSEASSAVDSAEELDDVRRAVRCLPLLSFSFLLPFLIFKYIYTSTSIF